MGAENFLSLSWGNVSAISGVPQGWVCFPLYQPHLLQRLLHFTPRRLPRHRTFELKLELSGLWAGSKRRLQPRPWCPAGVRGHMAVLAPPVVAMPAQPRQGRDGDKASRWSVSGWRQGCALLPAGGPASPCSLSAGLQAPSPLNFIPTL